MNESMDHYLRQLSLDLVAINNIAPSTRVELLRQIENGLSVNRPKRGWPPFWAKGKRADPINARAETVMTGKLFKELWPRGRAIAPAHGWFG